MLATGIKYVWRDADGTIHYEVLELTADHDELDIVSIETVKEGVG